MFASLLSGTDECTNAQQKAAHLRRIAFHLLSMKDEDDALTNRELLNYFLSLFSTHVREYSAIPILKATVNTKGQRVIELPTAPSSLFKQFLFAHPAQHFLHVQVPSLLIMWTALAHLFRCFLFRLSRDLFLSHFWPVFLPEIQHVLQLPTGSGISQRPLLQHAVQRLQLEAIQTIDIALTVSPTYFCDFRWWLMELRLSFATHTAPGMRHAYPTSAFLGTGLLTPSYEENDTPVQDDHESGLAASPSPSSATTTTTSSSSPLVCPLPRTSSSVTTTTTTTTPSPTLLHHQEEERVWRWSVVRQGLRRAHRTLFYLPHPTTTAREAMGPITFCGLIRWTPMPLRTTIHHAHPSSDKTTAVTHALWSSAVPRCPLPLLLSPRLPSFEQCRDREMSWLRLCQTPWKMVPKETEAEREKESAVGTEEEAGEMGLPNETTEEEAHPSEEEAEEMRVEAFFRFLAGRTAAAYVHRPKRCPWCCIALRDRRYFESWEGVHFATRLLLRQYSFPALAPPPFFPSSSSSDDAASSSSSYVHLGAPPSAWTWDVEAVRDCLLCDFYQSIAE